MSTEEKHKNKNKNTVNTDTLLSKFGFKCLMNKHDLCTEGKCECLCHIHNQWLLEYR
jgi:hypothetical protein